MKSVSEYPELDQYLLPNGEHWGNVWLEFPNLPQPERGRFTMICSSCHEYESGHNWKNESPGMWDDFKINFECEDCKKKLTYKEYLKTDHWLRIRGEALTRSCNRCQVCSATRKLNVHHNSYKNKGNEHPEDVCVLCSDCHKTFHGKVK